MRTVYFKIAFAGLTMAIFVIIQYLTRMASFMYALCYIYPFLIFPLSLANLLSVIITGGLGIFDMIGGFLIGLLTAGAVLLIRKFNWNEWAMSIPILLFPSFITPIWLSYLMHVRYEALVLSMLVVQILPAIFGVIIEKRLKILLPKVH